MSADELKRYAILDELTLLSLEVDGIKGRIERIRAILEMLRELEKGDENDIP